MFLWYPDLTVGLSSNIKEEEEEEESHGDSIFIVLLFIDLSIEVLPYWLPFYDGLERSLLANLTLE